MGGISIWQLLIILAIVILIFGTKRLKGLGGDLGGAIKSFRKAVSDGETKEEDKDSAKLNQEKTTAEGASQAEKSETRQ
ncbi:MAG: twin-arginine translocase TatA/TatE family subunit [Porticoccaceae bacterium]|nr:twin-arginine translocase TatA/TatE family subunit [Porticoccaceae bacterium]HLS97806.1 twin-arginine translocase TatA/TatE family subunit [Porticoccaceae bacterium]